MSFNIIDAPILMKQIEGIRRIYQLNIVLDFNIDLIGFIYALSNLELTLLDDDKLATNQVNSARLESSIEEQR